MSEKEIFTIATLHGDFQTYNLTPSYKNRKKWTPANPNMLCSYLPGTVVEIKVKAGDKVCKDDEILIFKAMKMNSVFRVDRDAVIKSINVEIGQSVPKGHLLIELESL